MVFTLTGICNNPDGWGPTEVPENLVGVPFAPYEKRAFIGRMADWSQRAEQYREQRNRNRPAKEAANEAFTAAADDVEGFALVDTQGAPQQPQWDKGMRGRGRGRFGAGRGRGRWQSAPPMGEEAKFNAKFGKKVITAPVSKWKKNQQANYAGGNRWNDQKPVKVKEASVDVRPNWEVKGQITFPELQKMSMEAPTPTDVYQCGTVHRYDKAFDRITPKADKPLVSAEGKSFYHVSTSDDPVIARLHDDAKLKDVKVFATDAILAVLMAAPRSALSWDIIINRVGDKLFLDKRGDASIDYVTCMETANDYGDTDRESINHPFKLSGEATHINQAFSQQVLSKTEEPVAFAEPRGPFSEPDEPIAPVAYRYRTFRLGAEPKKGDEDKRITMLCRCEIDAVVKGRSETAEDEFVRIFALNEIDSKLTGGIDWRLKLESQRGAVLANELKNNSNKLARWTLQAILAGADLIKLGYVSRANSKRNDQHVILGTGVYKPRELAPLINLNPANAWGILKAIVDHCLTLDEGKYVLLKDPNKPVVRFYSVPTDAFDEDEDEQVDVDEGFDDRD